MPDVLVVKCGAGVAIMPVAARMITMFVTAGLLVLVSTSGTDYEKGKFSQTHRRIDV